ncbi:energy-coupling factor ABC transporter ATP-binding protein [Filobacillus milosensis]|uniref:Energy-coupling factor ABC transporter ATP-binding protein n=1 Tax=Filobacillus milosensis TaxID=94137 RepID=A0A4Y8IN44_9BACI|nr:ABC transporter ATP-binding protein [Filobacillus milosensis]TFB21812.1 energy-coupling factor ABC transporter ATP-binding protein [Filobacillus milosensis]
MQRKPLIKLKDFSFSYEKKQNPILQNLNFSIYKGESTLLMGGSGSGKSTLALCLNGLYPEAVEGFSSGEIYYRERNINDFESGELNQNIGIVFQDPESQFCMIRVEDELAFTLENLSVPPSEMRSRIEEVLKQVNMSEFIESKIHELSGGQKQKIALASVLLMEPELLILDEPTANLDPLSSLEFIELIGELQTKIDMSILVIEHQADDWLPLINRVIVLNQSGELLEDGSPSEIFTKETQRLENQGLFLPKQYTGAPTRKRIPSLIKNAQPCLDLKDVAFKRKNKAILNHVSFNIHEGEFVAIVGQNGAGKSTLLQLMSRLMQPNEGEIKLYNTPLNDWTEKELRHVTGFVFQNPEHQFITDTVYDEIVFGMKLNNEPDEKIESVASNLLRAFHLTDHKWSNPFTLSGGQKRRLSVATMLDETPGLLLFDEPTFGQDAQTTNELMKIVTELKMKGTSIVFVTHDMDLVDIYSDRVIVLNEGSLAFDGHPDDLWKNDELLAEARLRKPYRLEKAGEAVDLVNQP